MQPREVMGNIRSARKRYAMGGEWGIYAAMSNVIELAADNAPRLSGAMAFSGYVTMPQSGQVEGGFGGPSQPYVIGQNRRTHFFTRAMEGSGNLLGIARDATVSFAARGNRPREIRPTTPHNARSRAAAAAKGGP